MSESKDKLAEKRAAVLSGSNKKTQALVWMVVGLGVTLASAFLFLRTEDNIPTLANAATGEAVAGEISYPVGDFDDGQAKFFTRKMADGLTVRYFIVKSKNGALRSAFDACDSCWPEGKGYRQEGDDMICGNCRMRFPTDKIGEVHGGCNPSPLRNRVENGRVIVEEKDLEAGRHYFDLPKKG
jgi:uncharacterized membrane protein